MMHILDVNGVEILKDSVIRWNNPNVCDMEDPAKELARKFHISYWDEFIDNILMNVVTPVKEDYVVDFGQLDNETLSKIKCEINYGGDDKTAYANEIEVLAK